MKTNFIVPFISASISLVRAGADIAPAGKETSIVPTAAPSRSHFRITAGYSYRSLGDIRFQTRSESNAARLPFLKALQGPINQIGSFAGYGNRNYSDGYVYHDAGTPINGDTWYWGYQSASQVSGDTLSFHGITGAQSRSDQRANSAPLAPWGDDFSGSAPVVQFDWLYDLQPNVSLSLSLQWTFLSNDGHHEASNFSATQTNSLNIIHATDNYALQGVIPPTAPYQGNAAGPGAVITNIPTSSTRSLTKAGSQSVSYFNKIAENFDIDLHTLSLGPTVETRFGNLSLSASAGVGVNILNWDAEHQETLYREQSNSSSALQTWKYQEHGTEILFGAYLQTSIGYHFTARWSLTAYGRYDWSQDFSTKVGPSTFSIDPTGWSAGIILGLGF